MAIIAEKLSVANYNKLDNIPVINQDLSASGFTPVANTYYRHTGATTDTFTQGVIYLYDTAYHKLGESGGGTTLNRYELSISTGTIESNLSLIYKIVTQAKGRVFFGTIYDSITACTEYNFSYIDDTHIKLFRLNPYTDSVEFVGYDCEGSIKKKTSFKINSDNTITGGGMSNWNETIKVLYYNDTEITL